MKKKSGFTLAELLIVLGITGVVAAVLLPIVNNLTPDKTKIAYLKVHDELKLDVQSLASNSSLYPVCLEEGENTVGCAEHPLLNTSKPLIKKFENAQGNTKLCKLLAFSMDATESCKDETYTYSDDTFASNISFTTKNGMQWIVVPKERTIGTSSASYQSDIYVDVDPSKKSKNCIYSESCKNPDRFKFLVAADGSVIPADPMGLMYLNTRKSFTKNKNQETEGNVQELLVSDLREFQYKPCIEGSANKDCDPGYVWDDASSACIPEGSKKYDTFKGICDTIPEHTTFGGIDTSDDDNTIAYLRYAYQVLSNAYDTAVAKNGLPKTWDLGFVSDYATYQDFLNSQKMFNAMKDGLSIAKNCGSGTGCFNSKSSGYYTGKTSNQQSYDVATHRYKVLTSDGMSMAFQAYNGNCADRRYMGSLKSDFEGVCGKIFVDIDGPNKGETVYGKDLYTFLLTNNGVVLEGSKDIVINGYSACFSSGDWCTGYVLEECNRNYLNQ